MSIRYIADLHLYDVYSLGWRGNIELEQFARNLLYIWNSITDPEEDTTIIVGDIGYCCDKTKEVFRKLNGKKVLVIGNHDLAWGNAIYDPSLFQGVYQSLTLNGLHIQHIPTEGIQCDYFIHGHHHRYDMPGMHNALLQYQRNSRYLNCSADLLRCKPMTLPELITNKEMVIEDYISRRILKGGY